MLHGYSRQCRTISSFSVTAGLILKHLSMCMCVALNVYLSVCLTVSTSASDCLQRLVSEMTCHVNVKVKVKVLYSC